MDGSVEYELKTILSIEDLNISDFAHTFLDDTSANEVRNTLDLTSKNELGYRQKNMNYSVRDIAYHNTLPTGWYLECTTAGTTSNSDLTIGSPAIGSTVSDGTVVWVINKGLSTSGGTLISGSTINTNKGYLRIKAGTGTSETTGATLLLTGKNYSSNENESSFSLVAQKDDIENVLIGRINGELEWIGNDLAGSAIQAKSLGTNGYIKYALGLIIQWGSGGTNSEGVTGTFPISFTAYPSFIGIADICWVRNHNLTTTGWGLYFSTASGTKGYRWFAIGC